MRSFTEQVMFCLPVTLAVVLLALFSTKFQIMPLPLSPNVLWVMTLALAGRFRGSWPLWAVFVLGLLQDVLFGAPFGSTALLSLLLVEAVRSQTVRTQFQQFRIRWLEAAAVLLVWHVLLWLIMKFVGVTTAPLRSLLVAGAVSALWFPVFYGGVHLMLRGEGRP